MRITVTGYVASADIGVGGAFVKVFTSAAELASWLMSESTKAPIVIISVVEWHSGRKE